MIYLLFRGSQNFNKNILAKTNHLYIIISVVKSMRDLCQSLIDHEANRIDEEWQEKHPYLSIRSFQEKIQTSSTHSLDQFQMDSETSIIQEKTDDYQSLRAQEEEQNEKRSYLVVKTKMIKKCYRHSDQDQSSFSNTNTSKKRKMIQRGKQAKKKPYPTKNFLPNFKSPHLQFLRKFLELSEEQFNNIPFISKLTNKNGISLQDYQTLYKTPEFQSAFEAMFACKYLYRELLLSRSILDTKKNHLRKVHVFENAFTTKVFKRIN